MFPARSRADRSSQRRYSFVESWTFPSASVTLRLPYFGRFGAGCAILASCSFSTSLRARYLSSHSCVTRICRSRSALAAEEIIEGRELRLHLRRRRLPRVALVGPAAHGAPPRVLVQG